MRSRRPSQEQVAEVARRRLELLSAELAELRPDPPSDTWGPPGWDGPVEPPRDVTGDQVPGAGRHAHRSVGLPGMVSGWTRDRLPATLQGGVRMSPAHLAVVAALLLVGVLATVWWVVRADGGETPVPPVALAPSPMVSMPSGPTPGLGSAAPSASGNGPAAAPSPSATGKVVVDVAGKVRRPGIAELPVGARVVDALKAAGGARPGVRLGSLNLARVLADGEQIVVGVPAPPGVAASAASAATASSGAPGGAVPMVNINTAGQVELEQLPGVGPVTAQSILAFRTERGSFTSVDELLEVSGIGDATLAKIAPFVTL